MGRSVLSDCGLFSSPTFQVVLSKKTVERKGRGCHKVSGRGLFVFVVGKFAFEHKLPLFQVTEKSRYV